VSITANQERGFYDRVYSRFQGVPDHALVCNRKTLEADLSNPAQPIHERRRLYETVLKALLAQPIAGSSVLDYGCGTGEWGLLLAGEGALVTCLDLSPVAIALVLRRAAASGVGDRLRGEARDASDLTCFPSDAFDLIFASAAIHHTLKYPNALEELLRVLKPGGRLILAETYGNNKLLNIARRLGWRLRSQPSEAGEDILFDDEHVRILRERLAEVELIPLNLLAMTKRLLRGQFTNGFARLSMAALEALDRMLLGAIPGLKRYCGEVVVLGRK
jgi:SAM-dependent methyltransferase